MEQETVNVFIAYAREDFEIKERLKLTLLELKNAKQITSIWDDGAIEAGAEWMKVIDNEMEVADIILWLVSPNFLASDACIREREKSLIAFRQGKIMVIPIIARHCGWRLTEISQFSILPDKEKPIKDKWDSEDIPYHKIGTYIAAVALNIKEDKRIKKLKEQFDSLFQQAEEEFKNKNWQEAIKFFKESFKYYDPSFEKNVQELIEFCQKQIQLSELLIKAKSYRDANDLYSFYSIAKDAFEIKASNEAKYLLKEAANGLFNLTIERADAKFLEMNWNEAHKRYEAAFFYVNEGNIVLEPMIIRRRDFCMSMITLMNETGEWLNHDKVDKVFASPKIKEIFKRMGF